MKLRVLGCSGAEFPGHNPSAFLIDDTLLLDGGTIGAVLSEEEQWRISDILVTHPHLDHIRSIPLLADNIVVKGLPRTVRLFATGEVIAAMSSHLMNGLLWPDFSTIPSPDAPVLSYQEIIPGQQFQVGDYSVIACRVNHTVPAVGYRISKGATTLLYTGDTGPTDHLWEMAGDLSALVVEVSLPNEMEETALKTGHLTPLLLERELKKISRRPNKILVTHLKPQYYDAISAQLSAMPGLEILRDGLTYEL